MEALYSDHRVTEDWTRTTGAATFAAIPQTSTRPQTPPHHNAPKCEHKKDLPIEFPRPQLPFTLSSSEDALVIRRSDPFSSTTIPRTSNLHVDTSIDSNSVSFSDRDKENDSDRDSDSIFSDSVS